MPRPLFVNVFPEVIAQNIKTIKATCAQAQVLAVVKANAYGHGLTQIMGGLEVADGVALLELEGARLLRQKGWDKPILLLEGAFGLQDLKDMAQLKCDLVVHNQHQLDEFTKFMDQQQAAFKPTVYVKFNTGMNRLGFHANNIAVAISSVQSVVTRHGLPEPVFMTHYANADTGLGDASPLSVQSQFDLCMAFKPANWASSLGNSAACLNYPAMAGQVIRPGIAIYGSSPGPQSAAQYGLKPALHFESEVIGIQHVKAGQWVGYGSRWQAVTDSTIGVVACGYADGYPRHAPDGTPIAVNGQRTCLVGRVSMDMLTIDLTNIADAGLGSRVQLWGDVVSVDEVAKASGTIGYELLCATLSRHVR